VSTLSSTPAIAGNPKTVEEAEKLVAYVESLFMPWNIDALVAGFTEDCIVRFGMLPEFRGREALRKFFVARSSRQTGYRLKKQFRTLMGEMVTTVWDGQWNDAETGKPMRGFGVEAWTMRDGKIAVSEAAFNVAAADRPPNISDLIG
jgi:nuclear transport factor 2 (NTF2) superfamily protein